MNLDKTKPRFGKQILLVPWAFIISRFHCINLVPRAFPLKIFYGKSPGDEVATVYWYLMQKKIGYIGTPLPQNWLLSTNAHLHLIK